MKKGRVIALSVLGFTIAFVTLQVLKSLTRAHAYSGPGIHGNLMMLEVAKARWADAHKGEDWPRMQAVLPYLTNGSTKWGGIRPVRDEIYILNKIEAPVSAYDPRSERLYTVASNDLPRIELMKQ